MNEFDEWIHSGLQGYIDKLNKKVTVNGKPKRVWSKAFTSNRAKEKKFLRIISKVKG